jgi:hypothetical protein
MGCLLMWAGVIYCTVFVAVAVTVGPSTAHNAANRIAYTVGLAVQLTASAASGLTVTFASNSATYARCTTAIGASGRHVLHVDLATGQRQLQSRHTRHADVPDQRSGTVTTVSCHGPRAFSGNCASPRSPSGPSAATRLAAQVIEPLRSRARTMVE